MRVGKKIRSNKWKNYDYTQYKNRYFSKNVVLNRYDNKPKYNELTKETQNFLEVNEITKLTCKHFNTLNFNEEQKNLELGFYTHSSVVKGKKTDNMGYDSEVKNQYLSLYQIKLKTKKEGEMSKEFVEKSRENQQLKDRIGGEAINSAVEKMNLSERDKENSKELELTKLNSFIESFDNAK